MEILGILVPVELVALFGILVRVIVVELRAKNARPKSALQDSFDFLLKRFVGAVVGYFWVSAGFKLYLLGVPRTRDGLIFILVPLFLGTAAGIYLYRGTGSRSRGTRDRTTRSGFPR